MRIKLRFLLVMAAVALGALPAAATTYSYNVGSDQTWKTLALALDDVKKHTDSKTDIFYIYIHDEQYLDNKEQKYNDLYGLRFYGCTAKASLSSGNQQSQLRTKYVSGNNMEFHNLTIKNFTAGGWNHVFTHVQYIENCTFESITSNGSIIDNASESMTLTITGTTFKNCTCTGCGVIYHCGKFDTSDSSDSRLLAVQGCSFISCTTKDNGAVFDDCEYISISSSTFTNCSAEDKGGVFDSCKYVEVADSTFENCTAKNGGGVAWHNQKDVGMYFLRCRFKECNSTAASGGVIYCDGEQKLRFANSVFSGCTAPSGKNGAVVYNDKADDLNSICNCTFYNCNTADNVVYHMNCYNCLFYNSSDYAPGVCSYANNVTCYSTETVFADTTDFKLVRNTTTVAKLIDKGDQTYLQWEVAKDCGDLNLNARVVGTQVDVGCTEWAPSDEIVVTSGENSGIGTLRDAIGQINSLGYGTITFDVKTVTLTAALPDLTANGAVNIGTGTVVTVVCSNFTGRALTIKGTGSYSLAGLHFDGGGTASAIANTSATSLTVKNCSFIDLTASNGHGGGILSNNGNLTVENCRFDGCKATGSGAWGGGIYCSGKGKVWFYKCSFVGCGGGGNGASICFNGYGGSGIAIQNCSFLENIGVNDILLINSTLPSVSIVAQCTFVGDSGNEIVHHAYSSKGTLCFASCLFANCPRVATAVSGSEVLVNVWRSLFSACVPDGCTYSTDTSFTGDGCYIVPTHEQPYVLGEKIESTVSGVTQTSYTLGRYSPAMEFPGWFIWRNDWSGVGYQRARELELGRGVIFGSDDGSFYNVTDQFGQTENDFDLIPITCDVQSSAAPPVGAIWNTPDDYEQPAWLTLTDVYNQTNHYIMCPIGSVTNAPTPTRPRATFNGWWTTAYSKDGGEQWFDEQGWQMKLNSGRTTLYARWIGDDHLRFINSFSSKVTLVGVIKGDPLPTVDEGVPVPTYAGCKFLGWYDGGYFGQGTQWYDANGNAVLDPDEYPADGDTYLFSAWDMSGADINLDPTIVVTGETNIDHRTFAHHATNELFRVESGGTLWLNSVTITGDTWCVFLRKSAILNNGGTVVCSNCNFTSLLVPTNSGAAYSGTGGSAQFINCSFTENSAMASGVIQASGGTLSFLNCTFAGNKAFRGTDTNATAAAAIAVAGSATVRLGACTLTTNVSELVNAAAVWVNDSGNFAAYDSVVQGNCLNREIVCAGSGTKTLACTYVGRDFYGSGNLSAIHATAPVTVLGSRRTAVCDGVTQTYYPPLNGARTKGGKLWIKGDEFRCQTSSPGSGWREATWDILGEQTASGKSISLRDSYIGSRRRNVLQDLIDATPSSGEWMTDMTLKVPADTYDPVDITRPIRIVGEKGAEIEAAWLQSCVTISNSPSPLVVGGMTFTNGGGAQGGGVNVIDGSDMTAVSNCVFSTCVATDEGGGVFDAGKKIRVVSSKFTDCSAVNGGGVCQVDAVWDCTFKNCAATACGGGVFQIEAVTNSTFTGCSAADGGGAHSVSSMSYCAFENNVATNCGGGVCSSPVVSYTTFTGNVADNCGGGAYDVDELQICTLTENEATNYGGGAAKIGAARGCTFKKNVALLGGGGLYDAFARESVFESNEAGPAPDDATVPSGGGAGATDAMGCIFRKNYSYGTGGGIATGSGNARGCLFTDNVAVDEGGAVAGDAYNCTFVRNYGEGSRTLSTSAVNSDGHCYDSLFYYNVLPDHADKVSLVAKSTHFYNVSDGNFHLRDTTDVIENLVGSNAGRTRAREGGWIDPENSDLVNVEGGVSYYYLGCYAFLPAAVAGVKVNGTDDSYEGTNLKISLREAIENAQSDPEAYKSADGKIHILFDDHKLFRDGNLTDVTLKFDKSGVAIDGLNGYPLVIEAPAGRGVTITGADTYRPFYVLPGNRLELMNLTISGTAGGPYDMGGYMTGTDGGAVLNEGTLVASNCLFRACLGGRTGGSAADVPLGKGGAICGTSGSTTMVQRCTFDGCRASRGGAIFQADGSCSTCQATTFSGNRAQRGGAVLSGTGGAVHLEEGSDAAFVNCTLANNVADASGAGVYAASSASFLNSIVVGNRCGEAADDLAAYGPVKMVRSWYGTFPNGAMHLTSTESEGGKSPEDVFAKIASDGCAVAATQNVDHVSHTVYRLRDDASTDGYYAWSDALGVNIGYATSSSRPTGTLRGSAQGVRRGTLLVLDQLGKSADSGSALPMGAVKEKAKASTDLPSAEVDPLCVTAENSLEKAFEYAKSATPKDGYVTITFDSSVTTVNLSQQLTLENFTAANGKTLRIVGGGVTITGGNNQRAFNVTTGNRLEITNLSIIASHYGSGGAIRVESGSLVAEGVAFEDCKTRSGSTDVNDPYCDGGAVALIGDASSATFTGCSFTECVANGGYGQAVYRETEDIRFYRCTFNGGYEEDDDIDSPMRVRVEHPDGTFDLFAETLPAFRSSLKSGDVVKILDADAQNVSDLKVSIPPGVTVVDETGGSAAATALMTAVKSAMAASVAEKSWYSVVETASSVGVQLNEEAIPELTGDGAEVEIDASSDEVSVMPANVKPGLWYGLGRSETPNGAYTVETWVQADANGNLPSSLTAPKDGTSGFYRVVVKE